SHVRAVRARGTRENRATWSVPLNPGAAPCPVLGGKTIPRVEFKPARRCSTAHDRAIVQADSRLVLLQAHPRATLLRILRATEGAGHRRPCGFYALTSVTSSNVRCATAAVAGSLCPRPVQSGRRI